MGVIERALRLLLPKGSAWALSGHGGHLVRAIATSLERALHEAAAFIAETRPGTATLTLEDWHRALGQRYDPTLTQEVQRARLEAFRTSAGGSTVALLQDQINLEYSGITITEPTASSEAGDDECGVAFCGAGLESISSQFFNVLGTVDTEEDAARVYNIVSRFAPFHLIPSIGLTVLSLSETSEAGLAICGLDECGNDGT